MSKSVERHLLSDSGLDITKLERALATIHRHDTDYADLYFQSSQHESWVLEDGIIKEGSYNIERGVGVRAISGEKTGFAYSDEISEEALTKACKAARGIAPACRSLGVHKRPGWRQYQQVGGAGKLFDSEAAREV